MMNAEENVQDADRQAVELVWSGGMDIRRVGEYYQILNAQLADPQLLIIQCAAVERMDTAFIQMLVVFVNACKKHGKPLLFRNLSEQVQDAWALLGLADVLEFHIMQEQVGELDS